MFNKIVSWLKESNHYKHMLIGLFLFLCFLGLCSILNISYFVASIISCCTVGACMMTAEYKDKINGGPFDLEDILAGMIFPIVIFIISIIVLLINL